ncbi:hypothetical protein A2U01_0080694, partial [Trifolium medium]|nr:hypothetical protein [Trifolium medium]
PPDPPPPSPSSKTVPSRCSRIAWWYDRAYGFASPPYLLPLGGFQAAAGVLYRCGLLWFYLYEFLRWSTAVFK